MRINATATATALVLSMSLPLSSAASRSRASVSASASPSSRRANLAFKRRVTAVASPVAISQDPSELASSFSDEEQQRALISSTSSRSLSSRGGAGVAFLDRLKIGFYFALWYALNVVYNIINKKVLNVVPAPLSIGTIQFGIGAAYALLLWITGLRTAPKLTSKGKEICWKVGFYHATGQLLSMISLGSGPVSFTHIVKALEPFFSALVSAFVFGKWMKPQVYATLLPVVGGVGYACLKERHFSWLAFNTAMGSNLAFALRAVVSKTGMVNYIGENMNSVNLFALVTIAAFVISVPCALALEKTSMIDLWKTAVTGADAVVSQKDLTKSLVLSGLFHYLNNEVMYLALGNVHPVTLAVGNTMKRVFIMVASVLVFRNPVSVQAGIGSGVGISGVLLYSLVKQHYEKLESLEAEKAATAKAKPAARARGRGAARAKR